MKKVFTAIMVAAMIGMFSMPLMADNGNHYGQYKQDGCGGGAGCNAGRGNDSEPPEVGGNANDCDPGNSGAKNQGGD